MSLSDPIGDMLARIKNSQMRNHKKVKLPSSKFKVKIAEVLKSEGYIIDYKIPFGILGQIVHPIIVQPKLKEIFNYRQKKLVELFGEYKS